MARDILSKAIVVAGAVASGLKASQVILKSFKVITSTLKKKS